MVEDAEAVRCESEGGCGRLALSCVKCIPAEQLCKGLCARCSRSSYRADGVCSSCFDGGLGEKSMKRHAKGKWCRRCTSARTHMVWPAERLVQTPGVLSTGAVAVGILSRYGVISVTIPRF